MLGLTQVSLLNKLGAPVAPPPSLLLLFAGWGFLVLLALPCVLEGGGVSRVAYRAYLGRVGGSRWGWVR